MNTKTAIQQSEARKIWLNASLLNLRPDRDLGVGSEATKNVIEHLGYVQIDTIFVIERCHHHILFSRLPHYKRQHLQLCQSKDKSVFEYWTHALAYVPTKDLPFFLGGMKNFYRSPSVWYNKVSKKDLAKLLRKIKSEGPLSIRDMDDSVEGMKNDWWVSAKPSKKILQYGFYSGKLAISERVGMLKKYEIFDRHFNLSSTIKVAKETARLNYLLDRSLKCQGLVSLESICHLNHSAKAGVRKLIEQRVKKNLLVPVRVQSCEKWSYWVEPNWLDRKIPEINDQRAHILSPFDPLMIQRKRTHAIFNYNHIFEAYVPQKKRKLGYFTLPVLMGDRIVAGIDLKTDRQNNKLVQQSFHWFEKKNKPALAKIEFALHEFEKFQLDWR